jgi:hypothetical protein
MKTKMKAILHFLIPALEVRELRREAEDYEDQIVRLSNTIGELRALNNKAPSFIEVALRDEEFGSELAEIVKAEAVKNLTPALSQEYAKMLSNVAFMGPPPSPRGPRAPAGTAMAALETRKRVYHVRIELPALSYDMQIAGWD